MVRSARGRLWMFSYGQSVLILLATALSLTSCTDDVRDGYFGNLDRAGQDSTTFYVNGYTEPEYVDPGMIHDSSSSVLVFQLFEGLGVFDPRDGHPTQGVATSWERSVDNLVYRFHLRPEARWSDGKPVTAFDFEYAWKRVLDPRMASRGAPNLYVIKNAQSFHQGRLKDDSAVGVHARDALTLDVELEQPTPYFLDLVCTTNYLPVRQDVLSAFEQRGEAELWVRPESIVVNGPYTLDTWKFRYEIRLKQNPYYWAKDKLRIHHVVWLLVDNQHATMNLYKAGEIDFLGDNSPLPPEYAQRLSKKNDYRQYPYLAALWYIFNTKKPPVDDVRVRRALNLAIDKDELVNKVLGGAPLAATHYVPDFTGYGYAKQAAEDRARGVDPFSTPETTFNPERGRALLAEAGYQVVHEPKGLRANGFPPLEILYNTVEEHRKVAVAIQDMWKRHLGISVTLRNEEWKVMLKSIRDGQFQIGRLGWVADYDHPETWLSSFLSGHPQNSTGWADEGFDGMMAEAARVSDPTESIRLYRKAELRAVEGMSRIPLYLRMKVTLVKPWVKGFYGTVRDLHEFKWLWIDAEWQKHPDNSLAWEPLEWGIKKGE